MSELINTKQYLDLEGLRKYDELIKGLIASGNQSLADTIAGLDAKIGSLDFDGSDEKNISTAINEIYASIAEIVEKQGALDEKDAELEGAINGAIGNLESLGEGVNLMTLVEIANKLKAIDASVSKNASDIAGVEGRVTTLEGTIEDLKNLGGENGLVAVVDKVNANVTAIEKLNGEVDVEGSVKKTAADAANAALEEAKGYADGLNEAMDERVAALEEIDHDHENKDVLDGISAEKVAAWDAAEQNAKDYADSLVKDTEGKSLFDAAGSAAAAQEAAEDYADSLATNYDAAGSASTALEDAKSYVNDKVDGKFDAAGSAAQALEDAKADAAGLYQVKGNYETAGAAEQALTDAKAYVDAIAHVAEVKYVDGFIKLYDENGDAIGNGFDASDFVVDGMLENVAFVKDTDGNNTNELEFTFNTASGKEKFVVDFTKYVDIYQADGTSLELTDKTFSIKEVAATKTKTVEAIPVAGGPLESLLKDAGINEIAAGTSIEDVLFSLICKELWASELTFSEGTVASSIAKPTFTLTKDGNDVSGTVEIGTKVVLSDITMGAATPSISKNRTYSGFTYGYSADNDNTQDSSNTSITASVDKAAALNEGNYTMSRDYTGFNGAKDDSATANADASQVKLTGAELVVGDGTNKVKVTVGGPTASATFATMPVYYACSNLKKTKDAVKDSEGQYKSEEKSANTVTSNNASNNKELSVTGKRYMFWGAHAEHKTLDSAIIREHANGGAVSTQAKTVTITIPESGVNQFYVALPSGRTLTKVYNTAAGEQFGEVTDSFTSSTIAVEGAEGYTSANYTVWTFNSGTAWVGPNTLTVIIG